MVRYIQKIDGAALRNGDAAVEDSAECCCDIDDCNAADGYTGDLSVTISGVSGTCGARQCTSGTFPNYIHHVQECNELNGTYMVPYLSPNRWHICGFNLCSEIAYHQDVFDDTLHTWTRVGKDISISICNGGSNIFVLAYLTMAYDQTVDENPPQPDECGDGNDETECFLGVELFDSLPQVVEETGSCQGTATVSVA